MRATRLLFTLVLLLAGIPAVVEAQTYSGNPDVESISIAPGGPLNAGTWSSAARPAPGSGLFPCGLNTDIGQWECWTGLVWAGSNGSLTVASTAINGGTSSYLLFDNNSQLGEEPISSLSLAASQIASGLLSSSVLPAATGATLGAVKCDNTTIQCSSGTISVIGGTATAVTVGTTTIGVGTGGSLLFDNAGTLGNEPVSSLTFSATQITSGTISALHLPTATGTALGIVQCDGTTISCTAGIITAIGAPAISATISTTAIIGGTSGDMLFDNNGAIGNEPATALSFAANQITMGTLAVAHGGTGVAAGSGTGLDNVSGLACTGFLRRTGAGTYVCGAPIATNIFYVSPLGSDSNDGLSPFTPKATIQAAINAAGTNGTVFVGNGTYTLTAKITMNPAVELRCAPGTTITQATNANLPELIDFSTNSANGAALRFCTVDGNRFNQTTRNGWLVYVGPANNVLVEHDTLQNAPADAVGVTTGQYLTVTGNTFSNVMWDGVDAESGVAHNAGYPSIRGNTFINIGGHAIELDAEDFAVISQNQVSGTLVTGFTVNIAVSNNVATITANSAVFNAMCSATATTICPGQYVIENGGGGGYQELYIATVTSSTVASTAATCTGCTNATNAPAIGGSGDLIGINGSAHFVVVGNQINSGAGAGLMLSSGYTSIAETLQDGVAADNTIYNIGGFCVGIEATARGAAVIQNIAVRGTVNVDCVRGASAIYGSLGGIGIENAGSAINTIMVDGIRTIDDATPSRTPYWLGMSGLAAGNVGVGSHMETGMINPGVTGTGAIAAAFGP